MVSPLAPQSTLFPAPALLSFRSQNSPESPFVPLSVVSHPPARESQKAGSVSILFLLCPQGPDESAAQLVPREHVCWQWTELVKGYYQLLRVYVVRVSCVPTRQFPFLPDQCR